MIEIVVIGILAVILAFVFLLCAAGAGMLILGFIGVPLAIIVRVFRKPV